MKLVEQLSKVQLTPDSSSNGAVLRNLDKYKAKVKIKIKEKKS